MRPAGTRSPLNALGREVIYLTVTTLRTPASLPRLQAGDYVVHMPVGLTWRLASTAWPTRWRATSGGRSLPLSRRATRSTAEQADLRVPTSITTLLIGRANSI